MFGPSASAAPQAHMAHDEVDDQSLEPEHLAHARHDDVLHRRRRDHLLEHVREVLDETQFPARLLELEITESSAMMNPEASVRTLYDLKKLGIVDGFIRLSVGIEDVADQQADLERAFNAAK